MSVITPSQPAPAGADPVAMISAMLDAERVTPDAKAEPTPPPVEAQPETDAPEPGNNAQVEGQDAEPSEGEDTSEKAVAEIPLDQLEAVELEVKFKGEDGKDVVEKLPIKALREGYMRQQDYSRKTAEVARQREEVGEKVRQAIDSERASYQQNLQQLQALVLESVAPELRDVNWNTLAANDPFEYVRLDNKRKEVERVLSTIQSKSAESIAKQNADRSQAMQKVAREARSKLEADIPGFNDDLYQNLIKSSADVGYDPKEVAQWVDPKAIKLLHKAYLYDQLKAGTPSPQKKVVVAPTAIKPGSASPVPAKVQKQVKALDTLRKSGRVDDLAAFLVNKM